MKIEVLAALLRAGFPLTSVDAILGRFGREIADLAESRIPELLPSAHRVNGKWYLEPTLEDLFRAVGNNLKLLEHKNIWAAMGKNKVAFGKTPKQALANFYLALKKK